MVKHSWLQFAATFNWKNDLWRNCRVIYGVFLKRIIIISCFGVRLFVIYELLKQKHWPLKVAVVNFTLLICICHETVEFRNRLTHVISIMSWTAKVRGAEELYPIALNCKWSLSERGIKSSIHSWPVQAGPVLSLGSWRSFCTLPSDVCRRR